MPNQFPIDFRPILWNNINKPTSWEPFYETEMNTFPDLWFANERFFFAVGERTWCGTFSAASTETQPNLSARWLIAWVDIRSLICKHRSISQGLFKQNDHFTTFGRVFPPNMGQSHRNHWSASGVVTGWEGRDDSVTQLRKMPPLAVFGRFREDFGYKDIESAEKRATESCCSIGPADFSVFVLSRHQ